MSFNDPNLPVDHALRDIRHPRIVRARLLQADGSEQDIVIRNVSANGLGATSKGAAPVRGERVAVILPDGSEVAGEVRWFQTRTFGVELDEPFDLDRLARALQRQAHVSRISSEWQVGSRHRVTTQQVDQSRVRRV